jgi:hypothetical protein
MTREFRIQYLMKINKTILEHCTNVNWIIYWQTWHIPKEATREDYEKIVDDELFYIKTLKIATEIMFEEKLTLY